MLARSAGTSPTPRCSASLGAALARGADVRLRVAARRGACREQAFESRELPHTVTPRTGLVEKLFERAAELDIFGRGARLEPGDRFAGKPIHEASHCLGQCFYERSKTLRSLVGPGGVFDEQECFVRPREERAESL